MTRIFTTLAVVSTLALLATFWLGFEIGDARLPDPIIQKKVAVHFLTAVAALVFAVLVHAIVLTYFMGTGRWLEETIAAYRLQGDWQRQSRDLKWRTLPPMVGALLLLIITGAFGAAADPASPVNFHGWGTISAAQIHLGIAVLTMVINAGVNLLEFRSLRANGALVDDVMRNVRAIRTSRGLT